MKKTQSNKSEQKNVNNAYAFAVSSSATIHGCMKRNTDQTQTPRIYGGAMEKKYHPNECEKNTFIVVVRKNHSDTRKNAPFELLRVTAAEQSGARPKEND